jgi:hypothetical protein
MFSNSEEQTKLILSSLSLAGLSHALPSLATKPESWVQIPYKAWMFGMYVCMCVCVCVCVVLCLGGGLVTN